MLYQENNGSSLGKGFVVEMTDFPNTSSEFMIHIYEPSARNPGIQTTHYVTSTPLAGYYQGASWSSLGVLMAEVSMC